MAWIRAKIATTGRRGAVDVGEYVLNTFFGGDPELAKSKNPRKAASYRHLAERCGTPDLPVTKTWLSTAVGTAVMIRRLPATGSAFQELPTSFQEALLPLGNPGSVERVAKQATTKSLSVRGVRKVVAQELARRPNAGARGRPPVPALIRTLNQCLELVALPGGKQLFSRVEIKQLSQEQRGRARANVDTLIARFRQLREGLGER